MPHMDESSYVSRDGGIDLADLWRGLRCGELYVASSHCSGDLCWATIEVGRRSVPVSVTALSVLERVLGGEAQKVLAHELDRAFATVALYCSRALRAISYEHNSSRAPILLVMAATAARDARDARDTRPARAKLERVLDDGSWLVSVTMPGSNLARQLSPSEWDVARAVIEGKSHAEIASVRGTSPRTVANQLSSVFDKVGIHGCPALRALVATQYA
jgi:DNA-binding CsgD family transcriptional regulator